VVGPSLANEIATGVPTAVVCASESMHAARHIAELFGSERFRTYVSDDVAGVEVGAIMKNVVAICIGMCDGLADEFGVEAMTNAKAFVFSRGLVEMSRLARALGGRAETILGLAGAGDLFVTALGGRNGRFGRLLGEGRTPEQALHEMNTTVEGYANARAMVRLAARHDLDLPIVDVVAKVVHYGMSPREAIERLVSGSVEEEL
jgi:glycerol-3-phosphate dehydrogenase (NAD(P)+)